MAATIKIIVSSDGGGLDKVKSDIGGLGRAAEQQGGGFNGLKEIATGAFRAIGGAAVELAGKGIQAIGGFLQDSISKAGDFQAGMLEFQAVAGKGVDTAGIEAFRNQFIQLGKELPVSTADVQKAAIELVKGGIDPATIAAGGLEQSIKFAAAAMGGDLAAAAETSAKVVGGWADVSATAEEKAALLTHATDLLTKAANASTVDVHDLALGLYNVQGTAKTAGLSLDETTTALAELAPRFANANTAGTSFRNFLTRIQPTTKPATEAMMALGLYTEESGSKFFDAQGKFVGVAKASQLLQDATKGLTDAQKTQALQTIFGNDAMNAAAAFAEMGAQGYDTMTASLENANGVAANAELKQQGLNTAMENFKGSLEALQITIGTAVLPLLTSLFNDVLAPAANTLTTLASAVSGDKAAFDQLSPSLQGVVTFIQNVSTAVQDVIAWFQTGGAESGTFGGAIDDLSGIWTNLQSVFTAVGEAYENIIGAILPIVQGFIQEHGAEIQAFFQQTWDTIVEIINLALELYQAIVPPILNAIAGFISAHGEEIKNILDGVWKVISSIITIALALIKGVIQTALQLLQGDWSGAWQTIQTTASTVWEAIKTAVSGAVQAVTGEIGLFIAAITTTLQPAIDTAKTIIDPIAGWFDSIGTAISGVIGWVDSMIEKLASIDIPDWLKGQSPPPMADWFSYIGQAAQYAGASINYTGGALQYAGMPVGGAATSIMNSRALTLNYTAHNYSQRSAQQDYATMSALSRSYA